MSQANKESLEQQLSEKIQTLHQLHKEALELEKQLEKQKREIGKKQRELEDLQRSLAAVNPEDPRHVSDTKILPGLGAAFVTVGRIVLKADLTHSALAVPG